MTSATPIKLTKKDFDAGIDVRWCPGCGDYAILAAVQKALPTMNIPKEKVVFISGIGCSSRFPYYMNTYGFHTIHGRAPAFATGLKTQRPDLQVWMITGDGDGLSIGGNHLIHAIRRNIDVNMLLFNNRIYGLTKGQYSPTSAVGKVAKSTPMGSIDHPFQPVPLVLGAGATFVARSFDTDKNLSKVLEAAQQHRGTSFMEIFQNCNVFNDGAFVHFTDRSHREDRQLLLEHGKPMVFGKNKDKGIKMIDNRPAVVDVGDGGVTLDEVVVHDAHADDVTMATWLANFEPPHFPVAMGVIRQVERPTYDEGVSAQVAIAKDKKGNGDLKDLIYSGDMWTVEAN